MREYIKKTISNSGFFKNYAQISGSPFLIAMAILDILLVVLLFYYIYKLAKKNRVSALLNGIFLLLFATAVSSWLSLYITNMILSSIVRYGALALIIIFQPEIRKGLEDVGKNNIGKLFKIKEEQDVSIVKEYIYKIAIATKKMGKEKTGALIVFERDMTLQDIIDTGVIVNADISVPLLENIFVNNAPLHDGAMIIRDGKIKAASCILPLSKDESMSKSLGTRHRAAKGVSEETDAVALVVSEETGKRTIAVDGKLKIGLTDEEIKEVLIKELISEDEIEKYDEEQAENLKKMVK